MAYRHSASEQGATQRLLESGLQPGKHKAKGSMKQKKLTASDENYWDTLIEREIPKLPKTIDMQRAMSSIFTVGFNYGVTHALNDRNSKEGKAAIKAFYRLMDLIKTISKRKAKG